MAIRDYVWFTRDPVLLTRRNIWLFTRYVVLWAFVIQSMLGVIATVRDHFVPGDEYGAILISDHGSDSPALRRPQALASLAAWFGAYPYWTYYFNNRGLKARWMLGAKSGDLERVIADPKCVSIVLVGHGSFCLWAASDKDVTNPDVERFMKGRPKKRGEWIQLTCGVPDEYPVKMGELVMDGERVYTYNQTINAYYLIADALFGFRYIKSLKRKG